MTIKSFLASKGNGNFTTDIKTNCRHDIKIIGMTFTFFMIFYSLYM